MSRIAAVTGASRGIGRATAWELATRGYRVFALARSRQELEALAADAGSAGLDIAPVIMDIADEASRVSAVDTIMEATGGYGLDVLINNAGYGQTGALEEIPVEKLRRQLEVNVLGLLAFTQPFLKGMREREQGWVVNVSSAAGLVATPFMGAYNASKFALEGVSDALRLELRPFGVHVVLIEPGPIRTDFGEAARATVVERADSPYARFMAGFQDARKANNLFERSPEAVARVIARAVESRHPRARYTVTLPAKLATVTSRLVPHIVLDRVLAGAMRVGR
jgi:short-subunit dehydrogenase